VSGDGYQVSGIRDPEVRRKQIPRAVQKANGTRNDR
jgi:hypothetical protein